MISAFIAIPRYAVCALLIFTPLARGSVQGWAVCIINMVTLTALASFLLNKSLAREWKWLGTPLDKPIFILSGLVMVSTVFSVHCRTSFRSVTLFANYVTVFYLVIHTVRTRSQFRQTAYIIIGVAAFLSVFGIIKMLGTNPFPWWDYDDLNQNIYRLTSAFGNPNHLAGYMEMTLPLVSGLFLAGYKEGKLFLMICLIILTALILSLSRGAWISSVISMVFMYICLITSRYFKHKKFITALAGLVLVLIIFAVLSNTVARRVRTAAGQNKFTANDRVAVWKESVRMITAYSLFGTGPGTFSIIFTQYQPPGLNERYTMAHNDYLHFTSEIGLMLIPVIIWMIFVFYKKGFKKIRNPSRLVRGITLGAMSGVMAILFHSISDFNLHIPSNALLFTVMAALTVAPLPQYEK